MRYGNNAPLLVCRWQQILQIFTHPSATVSQESLQRTGTSKDPCMSLDVQSQCFSSFWNYLSPISDTFILSGVWGSGHKVAVHLEQLSAVYNPAQFQEGQSRCLQLRFGRSPCNSSFVSRESVLPTGTNLWGCWASPLIPLAWQA